MQASLKGSLAQIDRCWMHFEHDGKKLTRSQVIKVLEYGISKGYETTSELSDKEIKEILSTTN